MAHPDHDQLISLALGDTVTDAATTDHLAGCVECATEVATLRTIVSVGHETQAVRDLPPPPPGIWHGIQAQLAATEGQVVGASDNGAVIATGGGPRRRRPTWAVAVGALVAAAAVAVAVIAWPRGEPAPPPVVAAATLDAFANTPPTVHGDAEVLAGGLMRIHVSDLPPTQGYYQVWLIDPDTMRMFPLGVLGQGPQSQIALPPDVNLARYSVVDVSAEQYDNNPAHSGDSLLRGRLS